MKCDPSHSHRQLIGGRAKQAGIYPDKLCQAFCVGLMKQHKYDLSGRSCSGRLNVTQLKSLLVVSKVDTSDELQSFPKHWVDDKHERDGTSHMFIDTPDESERSGNCTDCVTGRRLYGGINEGAVLLRDELESICQEDYQLCALQEYSPTEMVCTDDVSGANLDVKMVKAARALEMEFFSRMRVYDIVDKSEASKSGKGKVIKGR